MDTIYELLEVNENASKEEIELAYSKLVLEFRQDPSFSVEENKENEMILNKLKIAYEILIDDNRRKKYDNDLAKKRAESLIANVVVKEEKVPEVLENENIQNEQFNSNQNNFKSQNAQSKNQQITNVNTQNSNVKNDLTNEEKEKIKQAANQEFNQNLNRAMQAEKEYNEAYNKAYKNYMKNNSNFAITVKKIKIRIIVVVSIILVGTIMWLIPPIRNLLIKIYENNFIVKVLVDIVISFFKAIIGIFK